VAYSPQVWTNNVSKMNATRMTFIETGIADAHDLAEAALTVSDVPATNEIPVWNGTAWVAQKVGESQLDTGKIFDPEKLKQNGAASGQGIVWDGTKWTPGAISPSKLDDDGAGTGEALTYSGTIWEPSTVPPTGAIMAFGGSSAPTHWLLCDGADVSRDTYADLFGVIGTDFGAGDGSTTFNVPDGRGRVIVGLGTHADVAALGDDDGEATVANRSPNHTHSIATSVAYAGGASTASNATSTGSDGPAYFVANYIIRT
jgi:microcystin-dependent protein